MKKNKIILMALSLICIAFTACNDDYEEMIGERFTVQPEYNMLYASYTDMWFSASTDPTYDYQESYITAAGTGWKITPAANWVHISPTSGNANSTAFEQNPAIARFTVDDNTDAGDPRVAINMLQSTSSTWNYSTPITVNQSPASPYVNTIGETSFVVPGEGGDFYISFDTNDNWDIYAQRYNGTNAWDWMSVEEASGFGSRTRLRLILSPNDFGEQRTTTLYVRSRTNSSLQAIFYVTQLAPNIQVGEGNEAVVIGNGAAELSFNVKSDLEWEAQTYVNWLSVTPTTGSTGTTQVKIVATPNDGVEDRTGYVHFSIGGTTYKNWSQGFSLSITQRGLYLSVAGSEGTDIPVVTMRSTAYTAEVPIEANTKWKAEVDPSSNADWLTISPTSGEGNATLKLTTKDNPNTTSRVATVRVYAGDSYATATVSRRVSVMQTGKALELDQNTLYFGDKASTMQVKLTAEAAWTATTNDDWITVSPTSGSADATLSVSVSENKGEGLRTGIVSIAMGDKTLELSVVQQGKMMVLNDAPLAFESAGGKGDIYLYTNDTWTASVENDANWLSVSPASGKDSAHVAVTVLRNNYPYERQANVVIASGSGKKYTIPVQQAMRYLRANVSSFTFLGAGGEQGPLTISSDGTYSLSNSASWLSVTKSEENAYTLTAQPNTEGKQRTDTIVVKCTDLSEGTLELKIPVRQVSDVTDLTLQRYGTDVNWNITGSDGFSVTLTSYSTDQNWNTRGNAPQGISIRHRKQNGTQENKK